MRTVADIVKKNKRTEDHVTLNMRGDLVPEYRRLEVALANASETPESLGDLSPAAEIRQQMAAIAAEMVADSETFYLRAMPSLPWSDLMVLQPDTPTPDDDGELDDKVAAKFREEWHTWLCTVVAGTCYDPAMTADEAHELSASGLEDTEWDKLTQAAYAVNLREKPIPFIAAAFASPPAAGSKPKARTKPASRGRSTSAAS